jgi:alpha-beta hydrolase superfamily lysophospholipase
LIKIVESVVKSENLKSPSKPIYLVGDTFGATLALAVASRNPKVDLVLVLANPSKYIIFLLFVSPFYFYLYILNNNLVPIVTPSIMGRHQS